MASGTGSPFGRIWDMHAHPPTEMIDSPVGAKVPPRWVAVDATGGAGVIFAATRPADWGRMSEMAETLGAGSVGFCDTKTGVQTEYPQFIPMFGVHPWSIGEWLARPNRLTELEHFLTAEFRFPTFGVERFVSGVGEIGLDFAIRGLSPEKKKAQRDGFAEQLGVAEDGGRPVVIHAVKASAEILAAVRSHPGIPRILLHGFCGDGGVAMRLVEAGCYFSFSERDAIRVEKSPRPEREAMTHIPPERILVESDSPGGGLPLLQRTAEKIAALRGESLAAWLEQLEKNQREFFAAWPKVVCPKHIAVLKKNGL